MSIVRLHRISVCQKRGFRVVSRVKRSESGASVPHTPKLAGRLHFLALFAVLTPVSGCGLEFLIGRQHCPDDPGVLLAAATIVQFSRRCCRSAFIHPLSGSDLDAATLATEIAPWTSIVANADPHQGLSVATAMLTWDETQPCRKVTAVHELAAVACCRLLPRSAPQQFWDQLSKCAPSAGKRHSPGRPLQRGG